MTQAEESSHQETSTFVGGGEMGERIRSFDWSKTAIGPIERWPESLKTAVRICIASRNPIVLWWGKSSFIQFYNDAYISFLGARKHPAFLGRSGRECWSEIWEIMGPMWDRVFATGEATWSEDFLYVLNRNLPREECYFTFSYAPLWDVAGNVAGIFCPCYETTGRVIGERRLRTLRDLGRAPSATKTAESACEVAVNVLVGNPADIAFALIYLSDDEGRPARLVAATGVEPGSKAAPAQIDLSKPADAGWPLERVRETGSPELVPDLATRFGRLPGGRWPEPSEAALILPIAASGQSRMAGFLVAGLSPRQVVDADYRSFFELISGQIATAIANARAYEQEMRRAQALAEIDRAKTKFFTNVSHEFRTPLSLLLGPIEGLLNKTAEPLPAEDREQLSVAHRNALRLLKMVNTLLDFSRIEAGRMQAMYEPTELCSLTVEIASVFRSTMERAGLHYSIDCQPLAEPIYVDRAMWEKIVLNLLSNAFKFTFEGEVEVALRDRGDHVELAVSDTGVGIPAEEQGRVFERFHRIENTRARTYEGTGIGLAFVQELLKLHGGTVSLESDVGKGSKFRLAIPKGKGHLPPDRIQPKGSVSSTALPRESYIEEAERWLPSDTVVNVEHETIPHFLSPQISRTTPATGKQGLIVLADDNADMREYLSRLLGQMYQVHAVSNGAEALEAARRLRPSIVVSDIMMPHLDGFGLLRSLRTDPDLNTVPVILLSARAGEEARVEGFQAGADDYLVKPFTAREVLARVETHVKMAGIRREAAEREARLRAIAEVDRSRLEGSEERLRLAQSAAGMGTWEWDPARDKQDLSPELHRIFGTDPNDTQYGKVWASRVHPADWLRLQEQMQACYRAGSMDLEYRYRHPQRGLRWLYCKGARKPNESSMFGVVLDITDRKQAELEQHKLAAIVESSDDAIVSKDLNGIVTSWNAAAERIFGYTREEMLDASITRIIPPELYNDEQRILETIGRGESIDHFETERLTKSGERIDVSLTISPVRDHAGKIIGAAKIARDITQRKKAEQALRTSERLASVGRLAATVAHEINNPLEAVTNLVYLAKATAEGSTVEYLSRAEEELERISHLTRQTLGFYRETRGAVPTRIGSCIGPLLAVFSPRARNNGIEIQTDIRQDPEIMAVPGEMRQLLANFLSNSLDALGGGGQIRIRLSSVTEPFGERRQGVRLTIADSGPGIPRAIRPKLFEPFFTTKKDVGTGLGLWVCKSIVEKHQGKIRIKSSVNPQNSWTVFSVFLPLQQKAVHAQSIKKAV